MATSTNSTPLSIDLVRSVAEKATRQSASTRRGILGALGAAAIASPALASFSRQESADPLEAMWTEYRSCRAKFIAAYDAQGAAEEAALAAHPPMPASLIRKRRDIDTGVTHEHRLTRAEILSEIERWSKYRGGKAAETAGRWSLKLRLHDRWLTAIDRVDRSHLLHTLEETADVAARAVDDVLDRIDSTRPLTVAGALVKLRAIHARAGANENREIYDFDVDARLVAQVISDLERILAGPA